MSAIASSVTAIAALAAASLVIGCAADLPLPARRAQKSSRSHEPMPHFRGHPMFASPPIAIGEEEGPDGF